MAISRDHTAWQALARELATLVGETRAKNAVVADVSENVWCCALDLNTTALVHLEYMHQLILRNAPRPLPRGGTVRFAQKTEDPFFFAVSFAVHFLLIVWFDRPFDETIVSQAVKTHLPEIERLTLDLPPDDPEPEDSSAANRSAK